MPCRCERVVDGGPHFVARRFVALVVLDPEAGAIGDRRSVERTSMTSGGGALSARGELPSASSDRRLDQCRAAPVARADFNLDAASAPRFRVVGDRFLRDDVVRQDDEIAGLGAQLRRAPGDFGHAPFEFADPDPVADTERLFALDRKAGERVPQRVLQREADHDRAHRRSRRAALSLKTNVATSDEKADDDGVLEDGGKRSGTRSGAQRVDQGKSDQIDDRRGERQPLERRRAAVDRRRSSRMASARTTCSSR